MLKRIFESVRRETAEWVSIALLFFALWEVISKTGAALELDEVDIVIAFLWEAAWAILLVVIASKVIRGK